MTSPRILVGVIGAPHGVRGEMRIKPFTEDPLALKAYGPLETEDGKKSFAVLAARLQGDMLVVKLEGVADRDAAAALTHTKLYVPRERLPATGKGEYYATDLIGLRVEDSAGQVIGTVSGLSNFGAGDLLDVKREGREPVFVPFTESFVPVIDLQAGRIVVAPPDGLFDDSAENHDEEPG